jgi:hypothetical protein
MSRGLVKVFRAIYFKLFSPSFQAKASIFPTNLDLVCEFWTKPCLHRCVVFWQVSAEELEYSLRSRTRKQCALRSAVDVLISYHTIYMSILQQVGSNFSAVTCILFKLWPRYQLICTRIFVVLCSHLSKLEKNCYYQRMGHDCTLPHSFRFVL